MALQGALVPHVGDVDLLMSADDARLFCQARDIGLEPERPSERFASKVYAQWQANPVPVDIMGDFSVHADGRWQAVRPRTREALALEDGGIVYVPAIAELIEICRLFGRPKDLGRARLLQALLD